VPERFRHNMRYFGCFHPVPNTLHSSAVCIVRAEKAYSSATTRLGRFALQAFRGRPPHRQLRAPMRWIGRQHPAPDRTSRPTLLKQKNSLNGRVVRESRLVTSTDPSFGKRKSGDSMCSSDTKLAQMQPVPGWRRSTIGDQPILRLILIFCSFL